MSNFEYLTPNNEIQTITLTPKEQARWSKILSIFDSLKTSNITRVVKTLTAFSFENKWFNFSILDEDVDYKCNIPLKNSSIYLQFPFWSLESNSLIFDPEDFFFFDENDRISYGKNSVSPSFWTKCQNNSNSLKKI